MLFLKSMREITILKLASCCLPAQQFDFAFVADSQPLCSEKRKRKILKTLMSPFVTPTFPGDDQKRRAIPNLCSLHLY